MESRIVIIAHPNEQRMDLMVSDKRFNNEKYSFQRKAPTGHEERMLKRLNNIFGLESTEARRNELSVELSDGFHWHEVMPKVLDVVREFLGSDFGKELYLENRRRVGDEYDGDGWRTKVGESAPKPNIGVEYKEWKKDV